MSVFQKSAVLTVGCKWRKVGRAEGFDRGWPFPTSRQHLNFQAVQHGGPQVGHSEYVVILKINTSLQFSDHWKIKHSCSAHTPQWFKQVLSLSAATNYFYRILLKGFNVCITLLSKHVLNFFPAIPFEQTYF